MMRRLPADARRRVSQIGMAVVVALAVAGWVLARVQSARHLRQCGENLETVYEAAKRYDQRNHALPDLAFFPNDVRRDLDSVFVVLEPFGLHEEDCVCPGSGDVLERTGITYVWNVSLNGRSLSSLDVPVWMVVEVNALSADVPAPHRGAYHVLYTDGRVVREANPPAIL